MAAEHLVGTNGVPETASSRADEAARQVARGRAHLAAGELSDAAAHLAFALALAPDLRQTYAALDELAGAAGSLEAARAYFKGDGATVSAENAAAGIALIAAGGDYDSALRLLGSVVAAEPGRPWAGAPWFGPHLAATVSARCVARAVAPIFAAVGYPEQEAVRGALSPWLALIRAAAERPDAGPEELRALSGAARRLAAAGDAVAWCERAVHLDRRADPGSPKSLIMLGYALRDAGDPARAAEAWQAALKIAPANLDLHIDVADLAFAQRDDAASRRWAERAVDLDRSSIKARGALLAARSRASVGDGRMGDAEALADLVGLAAGNPQITYLRTLLARVCQGVWWVQVVPAPTESVAALQHYADAPEHRVVDVTRSHLSALEAPSAITAARARRPRTVFEIGEVPEPDMRTSSSAGFGPPLWTYRGTEAVASVPEPSAQAAAVLREAAGGVWAEPLAAFERAAPLGALEAEELLGLLAHVPPAGEVGTRLNTIKGLYWNRVAQAWVCIGILHHRADEPWAASARRALLLRLLHGPEDWTVDAAAFALCLSAWLNPEQRPETAQALTERYLHAAQAVGRRSTSLHDPLAAVLLICPAIDPHVLTHVRANLKTQQRRQAETEAAQGWLRRNLARHGVNVLTPEQ